MRFFKLKMLAPHYLGFFHLIFIIMMGIFADYQFAKGSEQVPYIYSSKHVCVNDF